ncbi:glycosyltransferase [Pelagibacterales bacterium]|nr:glycosyltransferase [Pelagibacterales bacterium]
MNRVPKVSIIINCFNGEKYLDVAINSVISQTFKNWELIFWDNKSSDKSAKIFNKYNDDRFKYFKADKHTLLYEARDLAINHCNGDLISFLDTDDWWGKNKLEKQIKAFDNPKVGLCCTNFWIVNEKKNKTYLAFKNKFPESKVLDFFLKKNFVNISTLMIRKKAYKMLDVGFDHSYEMIGDFDLVVRLLLSWKLTSIQSPLVHYRWHSNNLSNTKVFLNNEEKFTWIKKMKAQGKLINNPSYKYFVNKTIFYKILNYIYQNRRNKALKEVYSLDLLKYQFLSGLAILTPLYVLKLLRS